jgi:hypothetical protein
MKTYTGGKNAKEGFYFNLKTKEIVSIEKKWALPGAITDRYIRIPTLAMLIVGPVLGLIYVIFLPFISFAMIVVAAFGKIRKAFTTTGPIVTNFTEGPNTVAVKVEPKFEQKIQELVARDALPPELKSEITHQRKEGLQ